MPAANASSGCGRSIGAGHGHGGEKRGHRAARQHLSDGSAYEHVYVERWCEERAGQRSEETTKQLVRVIYQIRI